MVDLASPTDVAARIKEYSTEPHSEALRSEVNTLLQSYANIVDPSERQRIATSLTDQGVLPALALTEFDNLDVLGDDHSVDREDLNYILAHPHLFQPSTVLAADYVNQNFDKMDGRGYSDSEDGKLIGHEFRHWSKRYDEGVREEEKSPLLTVGELVGDAGSVDAAVAKAAVAQATARLDELLGSEKPDPQKVFAYLDELNKMGVTSITLHDKDGNAFDARIAMDAVAPGSPRSYLHLYATDSSGRERIALRAVAEAGVYSQQRDSKGDYVSFMGDRFARAERLIAKF